MKSKLIIALHRPYEVPDDALYLPVHVGAAGKTPFATPDDTGENISRKNALYSELTGLFYAWKNVPADALGLVHYRRYFAGTGTGKKRMLPKRIPWQRRVLTEAEAETLFLSYDIIVPKKRRYYIETLESHYAHTLDGTHLRAAEAVLTALYPADAPYIAPVYGRTWGYMFNMYLMRRELSDEYCAWLFPILFALEEKLGDAPAGTGTGETGKAAAAPAGTGTGETGKAADAPAGRTPFEARLYGRVSEILFNVWLLKKQTETPSLRIKELPLLSTEPVHPLRKAVAFLQAKFLGKKYEKSF